MSMNRDYRAVQRTEHPAQYIRCCKVEEVSERENGTLEVRVSTGEIFEVDPSGNEDLKLPEARLRGKTVPRRRAW